MKQLQLQLEALEPLIISDGSFEGMSHKTLDFIPGNMLLGALASLWVRKNRAGKPDDNPEFTNLFLSEKVRFGNAYPSEDNTKQSWPVPLCFKHVKNQQGMPLTSEMSKSSSPIPVVLNTMPFMEDPSGYDPKIEVEEASNLCEERGLPHENLRLKKEQPGYFHPDTGHRTAPAKQWIMHVTMDSQKRRAADNKLFGYQSLCGGTLFTGDISFDRDEDFAIFNSLTAGFDTLYLGHSRSAGYGRTKVTFRETTPGTTTIKTPKNNILRIFLLSDYMAPVRWESPFETFFQDLQEKTGVILQPLPEKSFCSYRSVNAYNGHWRLPRAGRNAIVRGSILSCAVESEVESRLLNKIMFEGLGGYRREGYGKVCFDPDFLDRKVVYIQLKHKTKPEDNSPSRPPQAMSSKYTKNVLLLRKRSIARIADEHVRFFLTSYMVKEFLKSFVKSQLANSQLGNLRILLNTIEDRTQWEEVFMGIQGKTAENRWKSCRVSNLITKEMRQDTLFSIMPKLLNPEKFQLFWDEFAYPLELLGGTPATVELEAYNAMVHQRALSGLIDVMKIAKRLHEKGRNE